MKITRQQLKKLISESFWREQQARVRQEQLPEDIKAAKYIIMDILMSQMNVAVVREKESELIELVSKVREKNMRVAVKAALEELWMEGRIHWEGGGRAGRWWFLNRGML
jgi:hypothetical protein